MFRFRRSLVILTVLASAMISTMATGIGPALPTAAASVPVCSTSALTMAIGFTQASAGNEGFPVIITNHGSRACSLSGFPMVVAHTEAPSPHPVAFVHSARSQIYRTTRAKLVVVLVKGKASFGVSFVGSLDQQLGQGPRCMMNRITVHLPGVEVVPRDSLIFATFAQHGDGYGGPINSCFAGFKFGLTPIVKGSIPPQY